MTNRELHRIYIRGRLSQHESDAPAPQTNRDTNILFHDQHLIYACKSIPENPNASIYFYDKRFFRGVMLVGHMEVLEDAASKEMIWQQGDTIYYPLGVTDPDYCVLKFAAHSGRYYANFKSETFTISAH